MRDEGPNAPRAGEAHPATACAICGRPTPELHAPGCVATFSRAALDAAEAGGVSPRDLPIGAEAAFAKLAGREAEERALRPLGETLSDAKRYTCALCGSPPSEPHRPGCHRPPPHVDVDAYVRGESTTAATPPPAAVTVVGYVPAASIRVELQEIWPVGMVMPLDRTGLVLSTTDAREHPERVWALGMHPWTWEYLRRGIEGGAERRKP